MNRAIPFSLALLGVWLLLAPGALAQPIAAGTATYKYENTFTTRLFPGSPFNPTTDNIDLPVTSSGVFRQVWQAQVGDTIQDELFDGNATGELPGPTPVPFTLVFGADAIPGLGPFVGTFSSITQDPGDGSLTSAYKVIGGPFAQVLADGTTLYTVDPYTLDSNVLGLPYPVGTLFTGIAGSSPLVRVRLGATIDPVNDPVIGQALPGGTVRITGIVPEPSAAVLLLVGAAGAVFAARRRLSECANTSQRSPS
ncbi:hypothetical protein Pla175_31350 [Pirellulimonas nuda]|uniref:PEP-CTERM protein-sorting domain-containing protein n=1 Tax=Pirellulimonas nuda TaxID=2528009 RepID=A0A518DE39_9BACT|nr:PEP-CTERM sorting domain-containing protein [Pirellulimonas nuda]QDU89740.1 hypothetical protein Pla175_31350 [Pirellulimonas nuda]